MTFTNQELTFHSDAVDSGTFLVSKHVVQGMIEQGSGSIVNIASVEGIEGFMGGSSYNASKGGVVLLTKNMAIDYARMGVRTNVICPGFIDTPLLRSVLLDGPANAFSDQIREAHQLGRFGQPLEIANAVLFLASEEASSEARNSAALAISTGFPKRPS